MSGLEGNETAGEGRNEYLLAYMVDTFETSHLLTSLLKVWALRNTARREKTRVRIRENVVRGDNGRVLTAIHGGYLGNIPLAHIAVKLVGAHKHCEEKKRGACQHGYIGLQGGHYAAGKNLLRNIVDTLATFHLLTSLLNLLAWLNTAKREKVRVSELVNYAARRGNT